MANEIKTRILLKYDSQANWEASDFILKKGEAAVCEMSNTTESGKSAILVKYGNDKDKFIDLPWTSALAADVYAWAKESGISIEAGVTTGAVEEDGAAKVIAGLRWATSDIHPNGALIVDYEYVAKKSDITAALNTLTTDDIGEGVEAWIFNCGDALTNIE